jgi:hypothetical protein
MVDIRRVKFNRARVKKLIADKAVPTWAQTKSVRQGKLYLNELEVVPSEDVEQWLRTRIYKNKNIISLSRDSGYTDYIARETLGISRKRWFDWLSSQDVHQQFAKRQQPTKLAGRKISNFGFLEMDLVEVKQKDTPSRTTDTYIFTLVDKLSSFLVAKRVDTKAVNPPNKARGTLIVFTELLAEMSKALGVRIKEVASDAGGEFKAEVGKLMKARKIKHRVVPLGPAIESRNGLVQRHLYKLIALNHKGGLDSLLKKAVALCNQTTSKIHKQRPVDAIKMRASEISEKFNKTRQRPGKTVGSKIVKGDTVVILTSDAVHKKGAFYKSYRKHWSTQGIVEKVRGHGIFVDGKSYPRNRVRKVPKLDKASVKFVESMSYRPPPRQKKKKSPIKQRQRSSRAGAARAKAKMKGMR